MQPGSLELSSAPRLCTTVSVLRQTILHLGHTLLSCPSPRPLLDRHSLFWFPDLIDSQCHFSTTIDCYSLSPGTCSLLRPELAAPTSPGEVQGSHLDRWSLVDWRRDNNQSICPYSDLTLHHSFSRCFFIHLIYSIQHSSQSYCYIFLSIISSQLVWNPPPRD